MRNSSEIFYARGERLSFHTAKTRSITRPRPEAEVALLGRGYDWDFLVPMAG
jgi:hypothetical protein